MASIKTDTELKSFGLTMSFIFSLFTIYGFWHGRASAQYISLFVIFFGAAGLLKPTLLKYIEIAWMWLGEQMGRIMTPLIMGLVYFFVITPFGLLMRLTGKDLLQTKLDSNADSYWIKVDPNGPGSRHFSPY